MPGTNDRQVIKGDDIIVHLDDKRALHATSHSLNITVDVVEFKSKDTVGTETEPGDSSWSVDVDALVVVQADATAHTAEDILSLTLQKKKWPITILSPLRGLNKQYQGTGIITSFKLSSSTKENATYSATITGSGELKEFTPPAPVKSPNKPQ